MIINDSECLADLSNIVLYLSKIEKLKLNENFQIAWDFRGHDIFVSVTGKNAFEVTENSIKLYDFDDNRYEFAFGGNLICEIPGGQS